MQAASENPLIKALWLNHFTLENDLCDMKSMAEPKRKIQPVYRSKITPDVGITADIQAHEA